MKEPGFWKGAGAPVETGMALGSHGVAQPVLGAQLSSAARPHTWARLALALLSLERQSEWELNMTKSLRWRLLNYALLSLQLKILYSTGFLIYYTAHKHRVACCWLLNA